jgi:hypothetical protein
MNKITLKEIIEYQKGAVFKSQDYQKQGVGIVRVSDFEGNSINLDNIYYISNEIADKNKKVRLKPYDVVITTVGATAGNFIRVPIEADGYLLNQNTVRLRTKENNKWDQIYLFYALKYKNFQEFLLLGAQGSAQPSIVLDQILDAEIAYPDNRREIAKKLFSIDQKIQLNTQINQTLEQIAQVLFKSWFVDFDPVRAKAKALSDGLSLEQAELAAMQAISGKQPEELTALSQTQPERYAELTEIAKAFPCEMVKVDGVEVPKGWEVKPLGDLISFVKGKKPKAVSPKQEENMLPHILTSSLEGKYNEFCESNKLVTVEYQNTIMLMDGSNSGRVAIGHNGVIGSTLAKINFDNNKLWAFIYQFLKHKEADIQANTTGTTIPHTDKNRINNYLMTIPNDFLLDKFTELFDNSLLKIISNRNQIISLETTRDLLLPRLLSGVI